MKKRLCILLALALVLSLSPVFARPARAVNSNVLYIGGTVDGSYDGDYGNDYSSGDFYYGYTALTDDGHGAILNDTTQYSQAGSAKFFCDGGGYTTDGSAALILKDFATNGEAGYENGNDLYGIYYDGDLTIFVKGYNCIESNLNNSGNGYSNGVYGIYVTGKLTIINDATSGGRLDVMMHGGGENESYAIHSRGDMAIINNNSKNLTLRAYGGTTGLRSAGICAGNVQTPGNFGNIDVRTYGSGNIDIRAYGGSATNNTASDSFAAGIYAVRDYSQSGNVTVDAKGVRDQQTAIAGRNSYGLYSYHDITVSGGVLNAEAFASSYNGNGYGYSFGVKAGSNYTQTGGTVNATGGAISVDRGYRVSAGLVSGRYNESSGTGGMSSGTAAISGDAVLNASGGNVEVGPNVAYPSYSHGIISETVNISGGTVTAVSGDITNASLTKSTRGGESHAIRAGYYTQSGGSVSASAGKGEPTIFSTLNGSCGLYVDINLDMQGGSLELSSSEAWTRSCGLFVYRNALISGGEITAQGGTAICQNNSSDNMAAGAYFYHDFTATGGTLTATGGRVVYNNEKSAGIRIHGGFGDATLHISGTADITGIGGPATRAGSEFMETPQWPADTCGVYVEDNVDICVEGGSLTGIGGDVTTISFYMSTDFAADSYGIYAERDLIASGGAVNGTGGTTSWNHNGYTEDSIGICVKGTLTASGAVITGSGGEAGTTDAQYGGACQSAGIMLSNNATVTNGKVIIRGHKMNRMRLGSGGLDAPIVRGSRNYDGSELAEDWSTDDYYRVYDASYVKVSIEDWEYDSWAGTVIEPQYTAYAGDPVILYTGTLRRGGSYSSETKPTEAGEYTVTVTYPGGQTGSADFSVTPQYIYYADYDYDSAAQAVYDGTEHKAVVSYTYNGIPLVEDLDYVVSSGGTATDVEYKLLTIEGRGNFTGSYSMGEYWTLQKRTPSAEDFDLPEIPVYTYDGAQHAAPLPTLKSPMTGCEVMHVEYSETGSDAPRLAGTYNATLVVGGDSTNFHWGSFPLGTLVIQKGMGIISLEGSELTWSADLPDIGHQAIGIVSWYNADGRMMGVDTVFCRDVVHGSATVGTGEGYTYSLMMIDAETLTPIFEARTR